MNRKFRSFAIYFSLMLLSGTMCLKNVKILVPPIVRSGDTVSLTCLYDLEKGPLYTIKWYLNDQEFYRYIPKAEQPQNIYSVQGDITVDVSTSDSHDVTLMNVSKELTGLYKCEISEDYPSYHTSILEGRMEVADAPDTDPTLVLERTRLSSGDMLRANCTSGAAHPAPNITWTLNGHSRNDGVIIHGEVAVTKRLKKVWSFLDLKLSNDHFQDGQLHLQCLVNIKRVYSAAADLVITEDKPLIASITGDAAPHSDSANGCDATILWTRHGIHQVPRGFYITVSTILLCDLCR